MLELAYTSSQEPTVNFSGIVLTSQCHFGCMKMAGRGCLHHRNWQTLLIGAYLSHSSPRELSLKYLPAYPGNSEPCACPCLWLVPASLSWRDSRRSGQACESSLLQRAQCTVSASGRNRIQEGFSSCQGVCSCIRIQCAW